MSDYHTQLAEQMRTSALADFMAALKSNAVPEHTSPLNGGTPSIEQRASTIANRANPGHSGLGLRGSK